MPKWKQFKIGSEDMSPANRRTCFPWTRGTVHAALTHDLCERSNYHTVIKYEVSQHKKDRKLPLRPNRRFP